MYVWSDNSWYIISDYLKTMIFNYVKNLKCCFLKYGHNNHKNVGPHFILGGLNYYVLT